MTPEQAKPLFEKIHSDLDADKTDKAERLASRLAIEDAPVVTGKTHSVQVRKRKMTEGLPLKLQPEKDYLREWEERNQ